MDGTEIVLAIIQARMSSARLPGKVMKVVNGKPIIQWQIQRMKQSKGISEIVVATSKDDSDDALAQFVEAEGVPVIRGSLNNVLARYITVLDLYPAKAFLRITADCPLFMPEICDNMIRRFGEMGWEYLSNTHPPTFPNGCDVEIVDTGVLRRLVSSRPTTVEQEHVTLGIYGRPGFAKCENYLNERNDSRFRWTLDTPEDLSFIMDVYASFEGQESTFRYSDVMDLISSNTVSPVFEVRDDGPMSRSGHSR